MNAINPKLDNWKVIAGVPEMPVYCSTFCDKRLSNMSSFDECATTNAITTVLNSGVEYGGALRQLPHPPLRNFFDAPPALVRRTSKNVCPPGTSFAVKKLAKHPRKAPTFFDFMARHFFENFFERSAHRHNSVPSFKNFATPLTVSVRNW